jgi:hypothetical protein
MRATLATLMIWQSVLTFSLRTFCHASMQALSIFRFVLNLALQKRPTDSLFCVRTVSISVPIPVSFLLASIKFKPIIYRLKLPPGIVTVVIHFFKERS